MTGQLRAAGRRSPASTICAVIPASIDAVRLESVLAPFGRSTGLPSEAYLSPDVFEWEITHFFEGSWFCVGRDRDLVGPGQARAVAVGDQTALLVKDDEMLRVFSNVCRHRGHELAPVGSAFDTRYIRCPYHAWTYRLDGSLATAPTFTATAGFDASDYPLLELNTKTWNGWLFVNLDGAAGSLARHVGNLDGILADFGIGDLSTAHRQTYEVAANWKLLVENYNECYHCTSIHPALCEVTPVNSGADLSATGLWCGGTMELKEHAATMSFDGNSPVSPLPGVIGERLRRVVYITLFPNLLISAHPDYVLVHRLTPVAFDRTSIECSWLFPTEFAADPAFDPSYAVDFWDLTNREDWAVCEGVQRGMRNTGYRQGPLSSWEATVYQFLTMVARAYLGQRLTPSPVEERVVSSPIGGGTNASSTLERGGQRRSR
jgi:phenylpropionate dioxygenase-like ring-hydroxylating dioxygenase large terminal subunit